MRRKISFKKGIAGVAAIAAALALTTGQFSGLFAGASDGGKIVSLLSNTVNSVVVKSNNSIIANASETTDDTANNVQPTSGSDATGGTEVGGGGAQGGGSETVTNPSGTTGDAVDGQQPTSGSSEEGTTAGSENGTTAAGSEEETATAVPGGSSSNTVSTGTSDDDDTSSSSDTASATSVTVDGTNSTAVANKIKDVAEGSTVTVDMSSTKTISKNVLEAAKGKNVDVVLDMGGYKWTINGTSISGNLKDVNMNVTFDSKNIPESTISSLAGGNSYKQISLDYSGDFGFTASLGFNVGSANVGKYVNLYYYNNNQLEYQGSGVVDKNGDTSLTFSHASDYVAIISDKKASATTNTASKSPVTADAAHTVLFIMLMCAAVAVMFGVKAYKKKNY